MTAIRKIHITEAKAIAERIARLERLVEQQGVKIALLEEKILLLQFPNVKYITGPVHFPGSVTGPAYPLAEPRPPIFPAEWLEETK
jgi:hypothetical protein